MIASIDQILDDTRNGHMFILVDDENRENEGHLIIPAQMATPAAINFMAQHGRGVICLALTRNRIDELGLEPQAVTNGSSNQNAFMISIEAREGVTTGISVADRARTILTAIDATRGPKDLVSPGHVFPLAARNGGVLVRAGHTEAAVDIPRMAGLNPSGVICQIMNDNGAMARLPDLVMFAHRHDLKIATIRDLISYRLRNDHLIECVDDVPFTSDYGGAWQFLSYRNNVTGEFSYVLKKGPIVPGEPTLVRVHVASFLSDMLGQAGPRKRILQRAMAQIGAAGAGVILILPPQLEGDVHQMLEGIAEGMDERSYGIGAQILADMKIHAMILLTNMPGKSLAGLEAFGLSIVEERAIQDDTPLD